jgi:hypothetical protein
MWSTSCMSAFGLSRRSPCRLRRRATGTRGLRWPCACRAATRRSGGQRPTSAGREQRLVWVAFALAEPFAQDRDPFGGQDRGAFLPTLPRRSRSSAHRTPRPHFPPPPPDQRRGRRRDHAVTTPRADSTDALEANYRCLVCRACAAAAVRQGNCDATGALTFPAFWLTSP